MRPILFQLLPRKIQWTAVAYVNGPKKPLILKEYGYRSWEFPESGSYQDNYRKKMKMVRCVCV